MAAGALKWSPLSKAVLYASAVLAGARPWLTTPGGHVPGASGHVQGHASDAPSTHQFPRIVLTKLGAFIQKTPNVQIEKHTLGQLGGRGTAEFSAVIARDPTIAGAIVKGLEIELKDGTRQARVYPDDAHLAHFELDLRRLASRREEAIEMHHGREPSSSEVWVTVVEDQPDLTHLPFMVWPDVPSIGIYGINSTGEIGVIISVYRRRAGNYYFPGADLSAVADFIAASRRWLEEN